MIKISLVLEEVGGSVHPRVEHTKKEEATPLELAVFESLKVDQDRGLIGAAAKAILAANPRQTS